MKRDIDLLNEAYNKVRKQSQLTEGRKDGNFDDYETDQMRRFNDPNYDDDDDEPMSDYDDDDDEPMSDYDAGKVRVGDVKAWEALLAAVEGDANIDADRFLQMWAQSTKQNPAGLDLDRSIASFTSASGIGLAYDPTDNTLYVNDYHD
jgi:hypothetical protein